MDLNSILHLTTGQIVAVAFAYWVFSTAVRALPEPSTASGMFYRWMYGFAHGLGANWGHFKEALTPVLPPAQKK